jgi:hypothetical protein
MAISLPRAVAALSVSIDQKNKDAVLTLKGETDVVFEVRLSPAIVPVIVGGLSALGNKIGPQEGAKFIEAQVMHVTEAQTATGPAGQPVLDLLLEGTLHFPVTFHPRAIPLLLKSISELQEATIPRQPDQPPL